MLALPGGQHFGQVELAVRRDRQLGLRGRDADFRQAPGAAHDGFPFQLHGQGADGQQRRIVCTGRFLESDLVRFQAQGKRVEAHVAYAGLAREFFFCKFRQLVFDDVGHQPEAGRAVGGQGAACADGPALPAFPAKCFRLHAFVVDCVHELTF